MRFPTIMAIPVVACGLLLGVTACTDEDERDADVTEREVPAKALDAIKASAHGTALRDYEHETKNGKEVYTAKFTDAAGKTQEIVVTPDGVVVGAMASAMNEAPTKAAPAANAPTLSQAMDAAKVSLGDGLTASAADGATPISGKFELEDGHLQLSVYTVKGGAFFEVIVDHASGAVVKSEAITGGDDLVTAKQQADAMAKAKLTLRDVAAKTESANPGYKVVSVMPSMEGEKVMANLVLIKGTESKQVHEDLR